ncbi:MAG: hypothetical protein IPN13_17875 [Bacteroidetes bacterium]|nr:hypothetical protein [Bacteroidota bacterium]
MPKIRVLTIIGWLDMIVSGSTYGISRLDFYSGNPVISYDSLEWSFGIRTPIFQMNKVIYCFIQMVFTLLMPITTLWPMAAGINPGAYANYVPDGMLISRGISFENQEVRICTICFITVDGYPNIIVSYRLYMTIIDMNNMGGIGR